MIRLYKVILFLSASALYGGNLLDNGMLQSDQSTSPDNWVIKGEAFEYCRTGAPNGNAMITVKNANYFLLRQSGITLVKGEKYRFSAMIRTRNFSCRKPLLVVVNDGWKVDSGFRKFPKNSEWKLIKTVFTAVKSRSGLYSVAFYLKRMQGEISIADIKLEALTKKGKENSYSPIASVKERFLVPLEPCLAKLPRNQKHLTLLWAYPVSPSTFCDVEIDGKKQGSYKVNTQHIIIPLDDISREKHRLSAKIFRKGNLEGKCEFMFDFTPNLSSIKGKKRLNNLVTELLNRNVIGDEEISFVNDRDGWIFFAVESENDCSLMLNGKAIPLFKREGNRQERMHRLKAGEYRIALQSKSSAKLIIRAISELFKYPACYDSYVPGNGKYDWEFHKKYILDACNVLNGAFILPKNRKELLERGVEWFSNLAIRSDIVKLDGKMLAKKIEDSPRFTSKERQGITIDEIFFYRSTKGLINYATALRQMKNPCNKPIYSWYVGSPTIPGVHHDLISAAINASAGRGVMLFEAYCQPQHDEKAARIFAENKILTAIRQMNAFIPGSSRKLGIILGNFTQIPILSLDHLPDVDFKYYLDMQMNIIANNPECRDIATVGYWGCHYADEELLRWSFRLLYHYGVEGKTSMLSEQYGYKYQPNLLKNCDFTDGLKHWKVSGDVRQDSLKGFGKNNMKLWSGSCGDNFAVFKCNNKVNSISQTVKGLIPGKLYSLQFVVADLADVKGNIINPRKLPVKISISNSEIIPNKSYIYVDNRKETKKTKFGRINLHRIVFRATESISELRFSTQEKSGKELIINHIMIKPYFEN
jgi:hypothetical protein